MRLYGYPRRCVARSLLAIFLLLQLTAVAASWLPRPASQQICSADGHILLVGVDGGPAGGTPTSVLHCALCLPVSAPPPASVAPEAASTPLVAHIAWIRTDAGFVLRTRSPLPPRGPPPAS